MADANQIMQPENDFDHQNLINRYRNRLDEIRTWYQHLPDVMLAVSGYAMDLAGTRGTTSRIPGGDALAMLGPWASDADHGDDLPHPAQVCHEWVEAINGHPRPTFTENWRWLRDHVPQILESQWAPAWRQDIDALWHRLAKLTGNEPEREPEPEITSEMVVDALRQNPEHRLTRRDLSTIFKIPASTITTWRSRGLETDERGKYRAGDILERLAG